MKPARKRQKLCCNQSASSNFVERKIKTDWRYGFAELSGVDVCTDILLVIMSFCQHDNVSLSGAGSASVAMRWAFLNTWRSLVISPRFRGALPPDAVLSACRSLTVICSPRPTDEWKSALRAPLGMLRAVEGLRIEVEDTPHALGAKPESKRGVSPSPLRAFLGYHVLVMSRFSESLRTIDIGIVQLHKIPWRVLSSFRVLESISAHWRGGGVELRAAIGRLESAMAIPSLEKFRIELRTPNNLNLFMKNSAAGCHIKKLEISVLGWSGLGGEPLWKLLRWSSEMRDLREISVDADSISDSDPLMECDEIVKTSNSFSRLADGINVQCATFSLKFWSGARVIVRKRKRTSALVSVFMGTRGPAYGEDSA